MLHITSYLLTTVFKLKFKLEFKRKSMEIVRQKIVRGKKLGQNCVNQHWKVFERLYLVLEWCVWYWDGVFIMFYQFFLLQNLILIAVMYLLWAQYHHFCNLVQNQNVFFLFLFSTACSCVLLSCCWQPPGTVCLFGI